MNGVKAGVDNLEGPMGRLRRVRSCGNYRRICQAGEEAGFVAQRSDGRVVRVARMPVWQNDHARTKIAQNTHNLEPAFQGVFNRSVRQVKRLPPADAQQMCCFGSFPCALFRAAASSGFALRQVQNGGAQPAGGHAQQGSSASLFHVVAMGRDGQHVRSRSVSGGIRNGSSVHRGLLRTKADSPTLGAKATKRVFFDFAALRSE